MSLGLLAALLVASSGRADEGQAGPATRRIVLLAGPMNDSRPPGKEEPGKEEPGKEEPGKEEYEATLETLRSLLENSSPADHLRVELYYEGWPRDERVLDDADTIVLFSDGASQHRSGHPFLMGDRWEVIRRQMERGCGLMLLHGATMVPDTHRDDILHWVGGYIEAPSAAPASDQRSPARRDKITVHPGDATHPVTFGWGSFQLEDGFPHSVALADHDERRTDILLASSAQERFDLESATVLESRSEAIEDKTHLAAWALDRADGGRGFVYVGELDSRNLAIPDFRRMLLNGIAWTAKLPIPPSGLATQPARPIRAVIVTGHQYPGHPWRETTLAIEDALGLDSRIVVEGVPDVEFLASRRLHDYDVVLLNYCNWEQPEGLSEEGQENFVRYLKQGGGLVIVHFTNGAFHFSLPGAEASDWPEWRTRICRRVWDHRPGKSGHDPYGPFRVDMAAPLHPVTRGMGSFETVDELYFRQQGDEPIEVLATARSQETQRDEPIAFVHSYGDGRVFQTVLGHDAPALRAEGTAELIRRGTAWAAGRLPKVPEFARQLTDTPSVPLAEGRFGQALDARRSSAEAAHRDAYDRPPFTVQCWVQLTRHEGVQVFLSKNPQHSARHWKLYSYAGTGELTAFLPGYEPAEIRTSHSVADGRWHHVGMTFDGRQLRLYVDGRLARQQRLRKVDEDDESGPLWFGAYPPESFGCHGKIDDVRISSVIRPLDQIPAGPLPADDDTVGLWRFDELDGAGRSPDASLLDNSAVPVGKSSDESLSVLDEDHFEGFQEDHVADDRLRRMDTGPFFSGTIATPGGETWKGIVVRVGAERQASVCYDTELLRVSAAWKGFLDFSPARFGLIQIPRPENSPFLTTSREPGWSRDGSFADPRPHAPHGTLPRDWARYRGLHLHGDRVVLGYEVAEVKVWESPWWEEVDGEGWMTRTLRVEASQRPLELRVRSGGGHTILVHGHPSARLRQREGQGLVLQLAPHEHPRQVTLATAGREGAFDVDPQSLAIRLGAVPDLLNWTEPGPRRWLEILETQGEVSADDGAYVLDTLTMPYENPYRALMFASGHDFFSNGDAAVCTVHGDVWRVSGIDQDLRQLRWQRFATGLFQPLGLLVVDDRVHVVGRDQITILHDMDGDGEADYYENFNNDGHVTANGHEYVTCLERDSDGWFYFLKGDSGGATAHDGCLLRVSPDGETLEVFATGIRNGNGLAIGPDDTITFSPQEGNWTPASAIFEARRGGFYGTMPSHHRDVPPETLDPPLCWIPRELDNSSGGQAWVTSDRWGPLGGSLLHFSFGRCRVMVVLRETIDGQAQGGVSPLPLEFLSGAMRGRFREQDGQLYVTGLMGWVTSAVREGCFQRVRYTGQPAHLPVGLEARENGLLLRFTDPLDKESVEDIHNYAVQQWNYRWSGEYGSPEFRPSDPRRRGRDPVTIRSATLLDDQRSLFLEIPDLQPVMQMNLEYALVSPAGDPIRSSIAHTIHRLAEPFPLPARTAEESPLADDASSALMPDESAGKGIWLELEHRQGDTRVHYAEPRRLVALHVAEGESPAAFLPPGPFTARATGWIETPLRGKFRFQLQGRGEAQLSVNGLRILDVRGKDLSHHVSAPIQLDPGPNRFELTYQSPDEGDAQLRLLWSGEDFGLEPVPPRALTYSTTSSGRSDDVPAEALWPRGREVYARAGCANCHAGPELAESESPDSVWKNRGPDLSRAGERFESAWLYHWLLDPASVRNDVWMPNMLGGGPVGKQQAADLVAYLKTLTARPGNELPVRPATDSPENASETVREGERLFEQLGCISCHHFESPDHDDPYQRVSLHYIAMKQSAAALTAYLERPHQFRPAGARMPNMLLEPAEAWALSQFLLSRAEGSLDGVERPPGDAERGARLFTELGCVQCHTIDQLEIRSLAPQNRSIFQHLSADHGVGEREPNGAGNGSGLQLPSCLAEGGEKPAGVPDYRFPPDQLAALRALAATDGTSVTRESPTEFARHSLRWLRCTACHDRDSRPADWPEILVEEGGLGHFPEAVPSLTWSGEKLRSDWTERLLAGSLPYRARPWLKIRMPVFPEYARGISRGLAAQHGLDSIPKSDAPPETSPPPSDIQLAARLFTPQGLDCRQCHAPADQILDNENLAQGIGLAYMRDRLREDFYHRWMHNPLRIDPTTKMPRFSLDGLTTQARHLGGGDAERQFRAIWRYLGSEQR